MLACVAVLALWAGSYGYPGRFGWTDPAGATWFLGSDGGRLRVSRQAATATPGDGLTFLRFDTSQYGVVTMRTQYGFAGASNLDLWPGRTYGFAGITVADSRSVFPIASGAGSPVVTTSLTTLSLSYPVLFLTAVGVPLGLAHLARRRRRRAARDGRCPSWGYDLRATPELCPECGARPSDPLPGSGRFARYATALVAGVLVAGFTSVLLSVAVDHAAPLPYSLWSLLQFASFVVPLAAGALAARRVLRRHVRPKDARS
jgi:hypothetical protein